MLFILLLAIPTWANDLKRCYLDKYTLGDSESKRLLLFFKAKIQIHFEDILKKNQIDYDCLELIISKGYYKLALQVYENYFLLNKIDISDKISQYLKNEKYHNQKELSTIFKLAMAKSNQVQIVTPVVQWAQSKNHTLINIKFSHRQDAPACLNCKLEVLEIKEKSILIEAFGIVSHIPIKYRYSIELYKQIDPKTSREQIEAVGTMTLNLTKIETGLWMRLTEIDEKTQIWWDMRDNLRRDMDEFAQLLEKESEKKEKKADKAYKKQQKKREQDKLQREKSEQLERQRAWDYEHRQMFFEGKCELGWYQRQG
ncbi:hypothetical protein pb186bvf_010175 [Paramecium bursaria]